MKNLVLLVALIIGSNAAWAKAPVEDSHGISQEQFENSEGKILAGIQNQKRYMVEDMKIQVMELLQRVSTISKLNMDREHPVDVSLAVADLQAAQKRIESVEVEKTTLNKLSDIQEQLIDLNDEVEILTLEL